jgi:hypothetical protein
MAVCDYSNNSFNTSSNIKPSLDKIFYFYFKLGSFSYYDIQRGYLFNLVFEFIQEDLWKILKKD